MALGRKTGGRQKGSANRSNVIRQERIAASGLTPVDYLTSLYRDEKEDKHMRLEAAKAAAPYVHARLTTIAHTGPDGGDVGLRVNNEARERLVGKINALAGRTVGDTDTD